MLNPDDTMTPAMPPRQLPDGTYARQKGGRNPKGYEWDADRGLWVPAPPRKSEEEDSNGSDEDDASC